MENSWTPDDARDALAHAAAAQRRLAAGLRLPPHFHLSLGLAIAIQVGSAAWALTGSWSPAASWALLVGGSLLFLAVAALQLWRFRRLNGAWVAGLASRAVLGTSLLSSVVYAAGLALSVWAGFAQQWWLLVVAAAGTGAAYEWAVRRWWSAYRRDPEGLSRGDSGPALAAAVAVAIAALVLVGVSR